MMACAADGDNYGHPEEQGRMGQEVEEILHLLVDLAQRMDVGNVESEEARVLDVARFAASKLAYLAERRDEVGRLCPAVDWELRLAESVVGYVNITARMWLKAEEDSCFSVADDESNQILPRVPRIEYIESMRRLADFIRRVFPGDTAQRWKEMSRLSAQEQEEELPRPLSIL